MKSVCASAVLFGLMGVLPGVASADEVTLLPPPTPSAPADEAAAETRPAESAAVAPLASVPEESVYTRRGPLGPVRAGILAGIGAPDGIQVGLTARGFRWFGAGVTLGMLPTTAVPGVSGASVVRVSGEGYARIYPFKGAFFLGAALGAMQMKGSLQQSVQAFHQTQHAEAHAYAHSVYLAPQIGFLWMTRSGISFGSDIGAQIPIITADVTYDAEKYGLVTPVEPKGSLASAMRFAASFPIPVVNLLRIGYVL
ncbi:hypothetical protein BH11MYX4_BH11MYX4_06330 [soil metagenome]